MTTNRRLMRLAGGLLPNEFARYDALCRQFGSRLTTDQKYYIAERVKLGREPDHERVAALGKVTVFEQEGGRYLMGSRNAGFGKPDWRD